MKTIRVILFTLLAISISGSLSAQKFGRYQVAIIAQGGDRVYADMVQKALGEDKRFLFISEKDIPFILKEWEKRQSGITEDDSITLLKNVDYFVQATNVRNSGPILVKHESKDKDGNVTVTYTYETEISLDIKVTDIQGGGEVKSRGASGRGSDENAAFSVKSAMNSLQSNIKVAVAILFPINAEIFDLSSTHVKMLSGTEQGVKDGQKYILKSKKKVNIGGKERNFETDIGFVQVKKVHDDNAEAFVIFLDNMDDKKDAFIWAEEKYFSNIAMELSLVGAMNRGEFATLKDSIFEIGAGVLMGNLFQYGVAADLFINGRYLGVNPALELRYNFHVYKGLFFLVGLDAGVSYIQTVSNLRVHASDPGTYTGIPDKNGIIEVQSKQLIVKSILGYATIHAGVKLFFSPHVYGLVTAGYAYSPDAKFKYVQDKDTPEELLNSIEDYSSYVPTMAVRGAKIALTVGVIF